MMLAANMLSPAIVAAVRAEDTPARAQTFLGRRRDKARPASYLARAANQRCCQAIFS
jgi:hypothetical protein